MDELSVIPRQSQLARQSTSVLADKLTESLRISGDMDYVMATQKYVGVVLLSSLRLIADLTCSSFSDADMDVDGDTEVRPATAHNSQFTQSLMLFVCLFFSFFVHVDLTPSISSHSLKRKVVPGIPLT